MKRKKIILAFLIPGIFGLGLFSCQKELSRTTGWEYNNPDNGGFEVADFVEQETGPGLILIQGGTFMMGTTEDNVNYDWNNIPRRVTVSSFYLDETEVSNIDYLEYLYWTGRVYGMDYPEVFKKALPDTLVWRNKLAYNEPLVELYLRHPAYRNYPVVGINWHQANNYCAWRTDRVNEMILVQNGILDWDPDQLNENNFNTDAYLTGQYEGLVRSPLRDLNPSSSGERKVRMEDGILLPRYRLPTEAEWEFAALGLIGNTQFERILERRTYPWTGNYTRTNDDKFYGNFMANFMRGRGDYMGVAGNLNDGADIPAPVTSYFPNDYGLYNMAGNVSEWVLDVYRPLTYEDMSDFRPFRGNVFQTQKRDKEGFIEEKDSLGHIKWRDVSVDENLLRRNYRKSDNINYLDGDFASTLAKDWLDDKQNSLSEDDITKQMYDYSVTSMINDHARVYKGGSWKDRAYYLSPGTRRFLDEDQSTDYIGFRCAMVRVGSPVAGGN